MKLELGYIFIKDIQFGNVSKVENGVLTVNKEELIALVKEDALISHADFDIARPGESVRIAPVKDVIEPRVKVEGTGSMFPGTLNKVETVGNGKTHVLKGAAIVTTGKIVAFQEGIIDMSGEGAKYSPFSETLNLVMIADAPEGTQQHAHEKAIRMAGLRVSEYVGKLGKDVKADEYHTFETPNVMEGAKMYPNLPRVAYVLMLQTQGLMHDTYVYGVDMKQSISTMIYPTEIMDGAIISGNCVSACDKNTTYHHMNNPVVHDMFDAHGKTINFVGVIITNENVYLMDKERSSDWSAKLAAFLGLDGVIISQEGFGNPDTDLIMNCKKIEAKGIKTVIITDEYAGRDGKSQSLADADIAADAVVTGGNANEVVVLGPMDKYIGYVDENTINRIAGGFGSDPVHGASLKADGSIIVEIQAITGATNELGFNKMSAR